MTFLYCADPLNPRKVDPHFAEEAALVRELGGNVLRADHNDLLRAEVPAIALSVPAIALSGPPAAAGPATERQDAHSTGGAAKPLIYSGWMLPAKNYAAMDAAFAANGVSLATTAACGGWTEIRS